jgi:hypothetical protein
MAKRTQKLVMARQGKTFSNGMTREAITVGMAPITMYRNEQGVLSAMDARHACEVA